MRSEVSLNPKMKRIEGYASVFEQRTDLGFWSEEFAIGSFDDVLSRDDLDVRGLFNHDPNYLLGRSISGTLRASADSHGLQYEIDLPDTTIGNDVHVLAERGDLTGASISFIPGDFDTMEDGQLDRHTRVEGLFDISPVTFPAYEGTETEARSRNALIRNRNRARAILIRQRMRNSNG